VAVRELPFVVEPPASPQAADRAAADAAHRWGLDPPQLLRRGMTAVYAAGEAVVLRVCRPTADATGALELAEVLLAHGVTVPRPMRDDAVVHGDLSVLAVERLHPDGTDPDWRRVGEMIAALHALDASAVPAGHPLPRGIEFPWWQLDALLTESTERLGDRLDRIAATAMRRSLDRHRTTLRDVRQAPTVLCHGDVHPGNVVQTADGPVLIDWDLLCHETPGWDHAMLLRYAEVWGGPPGTYERFAAGYGADLRHDRTAAALAELRLLAATLMRLRAGETDPAAAAEAERRLRWWRGDPTAAPWQAM